MKNVDYEKLRIQTPFRWFASSTPDAFLKLTGIGYREYYLNPDAGIELFRKGRPLFRELFGPDVDCMGLTTPPIVYGHINTLGAELIFPEVGEVNYSKICHNLEEAIEVVKRDIDFAAAGMAAFYVDYYHKLKEAFKGENCIFFYKREGPLSTAYSLLGEQVFYQPYDNPELFKKFLCLETESIIKFVHFYNQVSGKPAVTPDSGILADDIAAMFAPDLWPEFVLPYWEQYYRGVTTGRRLVHVEGLSSKYLHFLEDVKIEDYDPSISPKLNPEIINNNCGVPFGWRLGSFHYPSLSEQEVADFVFQAVADGASYVFTCVEGSMCTEETAKKVKSFAAAAKEVGLMLDKGASRSEIGKNVSNAGRQKFWNNWPE